MQAAATVLGLSEGDIGAGGSFRQLGGDSLASIQFGRLLEELTGAALPVPFILDHSHSMGRHRRRGARGPLIRLQRLIWCGRPILASAEATSARSQSIRTIRSQCSLS